MAELVLTVGSNTWATMAQADEYFLGRLNADAWNDNVDKRGPALVSAYRQLSALPEYSFPSTPSTGMIWAQCEQALFLLAFGDDMDRRDALREAGVSNFSLDGAFSEGLSKSSSARVGTSASTISPRALDLIKSSRSPDVPIAIGDLERDDTVD